MKTLISLFCLLPALAFAQKVEYPGGVNSNQVYNIIQSIGINGVAVSNQVSALTVASFYTNATPHYAEVHATVSMTGTSGYARAAVTNTAANTRFFVYDTPSFSVGAVTNTLVFVVPPSNHYKIDGVGMTVGNGAQVVMYLSTNSGSGGGGSGDVTQAGLAAGSYDIGVKRNLAFTNISIIPTQIVVVVTSNNTNQLWSTGAGTAAANGVYYWRSSVEAYTNSTGCGIFFDGADFPLTNASGVLYLGSGEYGSFGWTEDLGALPTPTVIFGTNSTTYTQNTFTTDGTLPSSPIVTNAVWVSQVGSDVFGVRGDPQRPFLSLRSALTNSSLGDTIYLSAGNFSAGTTPSDMTVTSRSIIGSGRNTTRLYGRINIVGTNTLIKDLSIYADTTLPISIGYAGIPATNTIVENCYLEGSEDGIFLENYSNFKAFGVDIFSGWDCLADYSAASRSNEVAQLFNCNLYSHGNTFPATPVSVGRSTIRIVGGSITASNGLSTACVKSASNVAEFGRGGRLDLLNVALKYGSTNTTAKAINLSTNFTATIYGFTIPESDIVGSTNVIQLESRHAASTVSITSTGYTNTLSQSVVVYYTASSATVATVKDRSNTTLYTTPSQTTMTTVYLQPGWGFSASGNLSGTAVPF